MGKILVKVLKLKEIKKKRLDWNNYKSSRQIKKNWELKEGKRVKKL